MRLLALPAAVLLLATASFGLAGCGSWFPSTEFLSGISKAPAGPEPDGFLAVTASVALGPLAGPPQSVSDRLIRMLDGASRPAGLALLNYYGAEGDYRLQGDLKAVRQGNLVKLIYSWQVFDRAGARLGEASGTEIVPVTGADPWGEVTDFTLEVIANQGIAAVGRLAKAGKPAAAEASAPVSPAKSSLSGAREQVATALSPGVRPVSTDDTAVIDASEALRLVNDYRQSKGLRPLTLDSHLSVAASALAADMAKHDRQSHTGPDGADLAKRLTAAGYTYVLAAENVGAGQRSLAELIGEWKKIPPASRNMLLPDAKQMGIAFRYRADTKSRTYWTLVIASPR